MSECGQGQRFPSSQVCTGAEQKTQSLSGQVTDRIPNSRTTAHQPEGPGRLSHDSCPVSRDQSPSEPLLGNHTVLTEELGGVGAGGLLVVSEAFVDDLPHGCIEALQLLILGGHA